MANLFSKQLQGALVNKPMDQIAPGEASGSVKFAYFEYDAPAVAPSNGDLLKLCVLPKGAKVKSFRITGPDMGAAGVLNLGWGASEEKISGSATPVEAASANGLIASLDINTAAFDGNMAATAAGFLKDFKAEVVIQATVTTAWTATTGTIKGYVEYVVI